MEHCHLRTPPRLRTLPEVAISALLRGTSTTSYRLYLGNGLLKRPYLPCIVLKRHYVHHTPAKVLRPSHAPLDCGPEVAVSALLRGTEREGVRAPLSQDNCTTLQAALLSAAAQPLEAQFGRICTRRK